MLTPIALESEMMLTPIQQCYSAVKCKWASHGERSEVEVAFKGRSFVTNQRTNTLSFSLYRKKSRHECCCGKASKVAHWIEAMSYALVAKKVSLGLEIPQVGNERIVVRQLPENIN